MAGLSAFATDKYWTGATSTDWGTNGNWTGNAPSAADNAVFNGSFSNQPNLGGNTSAGGIWMTTGVGQDTTISASSGTLSLTGGTINSISGLGILVDNSSTYKLTISAALQLGGAQTWTNSSGNLLTVSGTVNLNNKALTVNGTGNTTMSGVISGGGTFTKAGSGTLTLSNTGDSYTGQLTVQAGTVKINTINNISTNGELGNNALAVILGSSSTTGTLEYSGSTASSTKTFTMATGGTGAFQVDSAGTTLTLSGIIGGSGALTMSGSGTMVLSGVNTYSGGTNINGGTLNAGNASALGTSGTISFGGGTLQYSASNTTDYSNRFSTAASQAVSIDTNGQNVTFATALTSSGGSLAKLGTGTLTLSAANIYGGGTTVSAGTLKLSGSGTLGATSGSLTVNGGTIDLNGTAQSVGNLTGSGGTVLNNSTGTNVTFTIGSNNGGGGNYAGVIADHSSGTGTVALTKTGSGTITLSGTNNYTGTTTVNAGALFVNGSTATGSAITVNNSGTILGGSGTINGTVNVASSGAVLAPGATGVGSTAILHTGALTLASGSNLKIDINGSTAGSGYDQIISSGSISLTGATLVVSALPSMLALGNKYYIVEDSATSANTYGLFSNGTSVTDSSGDTFTINYADNGDGGLVANDISLTVTLVVPEASTFVTPTLVTVTLLVHHLIRKRRRQTNSSGNARLQSQTFSRNHFIVAAITVTVMSSGAAKADIRSLNELASEDGGRFDSDLAMQCHPDQFFALQRWNDVALLSRQCRNASEDDFGGLRLTPPSSLVNEADFLLPSDGFSGKSINWKGKEMTIQATDNVVTLNLWNFKLKGSILTLDGTATTQFLINVQHKFSLKSASSVLLSGGVDPLNVVFNVLGEGRVVLKGQSTLTGSIVAENRTVTVANGSTVIGNVTAAQVNLVNGGDIQPPPVVSQ